MRIASRSFATLTVMVSPTFDRFFSGISFAFWDGAGGKQHSTSQTPMRSYDFLHSRRNPHHRTRSTPHRTSRWPAQSSLDEESHCQPRRTRLYAGVGSNSNVAENGIDKERERAAMWEIDTATGAHRVFASGLRNPVGMAWEPVTGSALGRRQRARRARQRSRSGLHDVSARWGILRLAIQLLRQITSTRE